MRSEPPRYMSYMLRLQEVGSDSGPAWRISLEDPHTGEKRVFTRLDDLFSFLGEATKESPHLVASRRSE
jgi:hypothetical protein